MLQLQSDLRCLQRRAGEHANQTTTQKQTLRLALHNASFFHRCCRVRGVEFVQ